MTPTLEAPQAQTNPIERMRDNNAATLKAAFRWIDDNDLWRDVLDVTVIGSNNIFLRWEGFARVFSGKVVKCEGETYSASVGELRVFAVKPSEKKVSKTIEVTL
jgi:hypothetical protein